MKKLFYTSLLGCMLQGHAFAYDYTHESKYGDHHKQIYIGANAGLSAGDAREFCDDKDISCTPWKALLGYRFNDTIAMEGSFHQLINGRSDADYGDYDTSALGLSLVASMPLKGKFESVDRMNLKDLRAFGRFGFAAWNTETDVKSTEEGLEFSGNRFLANSGTDFLIGGGLQMNVLDNVDVRGEFEYFGGDLNTTTYTAGVTYSTF